MPSAKVSYCGDNVNEWGESQRSSNAHNNTLKHHIWVPIATCSPRKRWGTPEGPQVYLDACYSENNKTVEESIVSQLICFPKSFSADHLCLFFYQFLVTVIHTLPSTSMFSRLQILMHRKHNRSWNRGEAKGYMRVLGLGKRLYIPGRSISMFFPGLELQNLWGKKKFFFFPASVSVRVWESDYWVTSPETHHIEPSITFQVGFQPAEQFGSNELKGMGQKAFSLAINI